MERLEDKACVYDVEVERYREKIIEMVGKIEEKRFLKAIYISLLEYLQENEPD